MGSGPIVIGQACEFDYSGVQACKALRQEGYRVVLVNSNPATIMTDPELADATYVEPLTVEVLEKIIAKIPMGRLGRADDIARGVLFLVADNADFITGATLSIMPRR